MSATLAQDSSLVRRNLRNVIIIIICYFMACTFIPQYLTEFKCSNLNYLGRTSNQRWQTGEISAKKRKMAKF